MEFDEVVKRRRSVRRFDDRRPDPDVVRGAVDKARRAPTAGFSQGIDLLALDESGALADFWALTEDPEFPSGEEEQDALPTTLVLVWSDPQRYIQGSSTLRSAR